MIRDTLRKNGWLLNEKVSLTELALIYKVSKYPGLELEAVKQNCDRFKDRTIVRPVYKNSSADIKDLYWLLLKSLAPHKGYLTGLAALAAVADVQDNPVMFNPYVETKVPTYYNSLSEIFETAVLLAKVNPAPSSKWIGNYITSKSLANKLIDLPPHFLRALEVDEEKPLFEYNYSKCFDKQPYTQSFDDTVIINGSTGITNIDITADYIYITGKPCSRVPYKQGSTIYIEGLYSSVKITATKNVNIIFRDVTLSGTMHFKGKNNKLKFEGHNVIHVPADLTGTPAIRVPYHSKLTVTGDYVYVTQAPFSVVMGAPAKPPYSRNYSNKVKPDMNFDIDLKVLRTVPTTNCDLFGYPCTKVPNPCKVNLHDTQIRLGVERV